MAAASQVSEREMAFVTYGVNSPETNKLLSAALYHAIIPESFFHKRGLIGKEGSLIVLKDDLEKEAGDRVRCTLVDIIDSDGKSGSEVLEGDEDAFSTYTDDLFVDEQRNAIKVPAVGTIEQQRVLINCRETGFETLRKWFTKRLNVAIFNQICANTKTGLSVKYTGMNTVPAPDADHIIRPGGHTTDQAVGADASATFTLRLIDRAVARAEVFQDEYSGKQLMEPISIGGGEYFILFLHTFQGFQLRTDAETLGGWENIQLALIQGGQGEDNAIFSGALGVYNRTIIFQTPFVPQGVNSSTGAAVTTVRRAAFCGSNACHIAFGSGYGEDTFRWNEKDEDYGKKLGVAATTVWGAKRSMFNSSNLSVIHIPTYAAEPTA